MDDIKNSECNTGRVSLGKREDLDIWAKTKMYRVATNNQHKERYEELCNKWSRDETNETNPSVQGGRTDSDISMKSFSGQKA